LDQAADTIGARALLVAPRTIAPRRSTSTSRSRRVQAIRTTYCSSWRTYCRSSRHDQIIPDQLAVLHDEANSLGVRGGPFASW